MLSSRGIEKKANKLEAMRPFYVHDKVIQTRNNRRKDVYNGEMGVVEALYDKVMLLLCKVVTLLYCYISHSFCVCVCVFSAFPCV
eukprot:m.85925 g.85925  ORF g.85925 m.85925 type:complete len:85 (+) comp12203_c0_seq2:2435-2689(+)